jgi:hypothetical protein
MDIEADPIQSPEHILLSNIAAHAGRTARTSARKSRAAHPATRRSARSASSISKASCRRPTHAALAMKLNNLLASPGFRTWLEGEPLDIQRMYYTKEGKPRVTIFCIAHLSDTERMFFVSLLLNQLLGWMRTQQGTTSLRALFYMDEIFGYLPPTAMPPSKKP